MAKSISPKTQKVKKKNIPSKKKVILVQKRPKEKKTTKKAGPVLIRFQASNKVSPEMLQLHKASLKQLESFLKNGETPAIENLVGFQFKGLNVGFMPKLLRIQKFIKCFYWHDFRFGKMMMGHNIVVSQNGLEGKYQPVVDKKRRAKTQGYYLLEETRANRRFNLYPNSVLLNYGRGDNAWYDPAKLLRDYLCQPFADNSNLLLGKAYFALGPFKIFGGFFILEKLDTFAEDI